jgi:hypothetical protein
VEIPAVKTKRVPKYTPLSRRHDRPNAILWLLRSHPELRDSQIMRLVGTTKPTIEAIRDRTHWNSPNLQPQDPVALGLCSQIDLDAEVRKAARRIEQERKAAGLEPEEEEIEEAGTLISAEQTGDPERLLRREEERPAKERDDERELTVDDVFGTSTDRS